MSTDSSHPDMSSTVARMLHPERIQRLDPFRIMAHCPITPQDIVGDVGCGPGYFTLKLAKAVIDGKLYAVDTDPKMIEACREQITLAHLGNVEVNQCEEFDFAPDSEPLDGAFLAFVIHESTDHTRFLRSASQLLKPNGWVTILEWSGKESKVGPSLDQQLEPSRLRQLSNDAGFRYRNWRELNDNQYMMTLRKV